MLIFVLLVTVSASFTADTCEKIPDVTANFGGLVNGTVYHFYNTSYIKYYVMTPSSKPNFINPDGAPYDLNYGECDGKPLLFNCHDWTEDGKEVYIKDIFTTFVSTYDGCAISSDYSGASKQYHYCIAACETNNIAAAIYDYFYRMCWRMDCPRNLQLHGLGLGAHICGIAGYTIVRQRSYPGARRMIASDAVGAPFNEANISDYMSHLSPGSAGRVINIQTSKSIGAGRPEWAHQTQYVGLCSTQQNQCNKISELGQEICNHASSVYMVRSTMEKDFEDIKVKQCTNCSCNPAYVDPPVEDSLGWKSKGTSGGFYSGKLTTCLDVSHETSNARSRHMKRSIKYRRVQNKINKNRKTTLVNQDDKMERAVHHMRAIPAADCDKCQPLPPAPPKACKCRPGFIQSADKCFWMNKTLSYTQPQAVDYCRKMNAVVVQILNQHQNENLAKYLTNQGVTNGVWTSAIKYRDSPGTWPAGDIIYTNWNKGEPNAAAGSKSCIEIFVKDGVALWNDHYCSNKRRFICETLCLP